MPAAQSSGTARQWGVRRRSAPSPSGSRSRCVTDRPRPAVVGPDRPSDRGRPTPRGSSPHRPLLTRAESEGDHATAWSTRHRSRRPATWPRRTGPPSIQEARGELDRTSPGGGGGAARLVPIATPAWIGRYDGRRSPGPARHLPRVCTRHPVHGSMRQSGAGRSAAQLWARSDFGATSSGEAAFVTGRFSDRASETIPITTAATEIITAPAWSGVPIDTVSSSSATPRTTDRDRLGRFDPGHRRRQRSRLERRLADDEPASDDHGHDVRLPVRNPREEAFTEVMNERLREDRRHGEQDRGRDAEERAARGSGRRLRQCQAQHHGTDDQGCGAQPPRRGNDIEALRSGRFPGERASSRCRAPAP